MPRPQSSPAGTIISADKVPKEKKSPKAAPLVTAAAAAAGSNNNDLLGISFGNAVDATPSPGNMDDDPFSAFVSAPAEANLVAVNQHGGESLVSPVVANGSHGLSDEADFFNQKAPEDKKLDLASILKLYDNAAPPTNNSSLFGSQSQGAAFGQTATSNQFDGLSLFSNASNGGLPATSTYNQSNAALLAQPVSSPFAVQSNVHSNNQAPNNLSQVGFALFSGNADLD